MITYTLNQQPVHRNVYDGASDSAKLMAELFERLIELEESKKGQAGGLVRRLATLADLSSGAFRMVLEFGRGNTRALLASYEEQAINRGCTRQAIHWQWQQDLKAIKLCFPELEALMREYRDSIERREGALSAADGLRMALSGAQRSDPKEGA
jgi:hypothetical protein